MSVIKINLNSQCENFQTQPTIVPQPTLPDYTKTDLSVQEKLITMSEIQKECIYVTTVNDLIEVKARLKNELMIAVDLEHSTNYKPPSTSLIQISTSTANFILDVMFLPRNYVTMILGPIFSNKNIIKVMHAPHMDVIWLKRDFNINIRTLFDIQYAFSLLNGQKQPCSLANILKALLNVEIDKSLQYSSWQNRPLLLSQLKYAYIDTKYLLPAYNSLIVKLHSIEIKEIYNRGLNISTKVFVNSSQNYKRKNRKTSPYSYNDRSHR